MSGSDKSRSRGGSRFLRRLRGAMPFSNAGRSPEGGYSRHLIIAIAFVAAVVALFPRSKSYQFSELKEGEVYVGEQIVAPFTFSINKSEAEYNRDIEAAKQGVPLVFVRNDSVGEGYLRDLSTVIDSTERLLNSIAVDSAKIAQIKALYSDYKVIATEENLTFLLYKLRASPVKPADGKKKTAAVVDTSLIDFKMFSETLMRIARDLYSIGIMNVVPDQLPNTPRTVHIDTGKDELLEEVNAFLNTETVKTTLLEKLRAAFQDEAATKAGYELLIAALRPNIFYREDETDRRIQLAVSRVPRAKGTVLDKEKIIASHERATAEHVQKLQSLAEAKSRMEGREEGFGFLPPLFGKIMLVILGMSFLAVYLFSMERKLFRDARKILMMAISLLLVLFLGHLVGQFALSEYLIPAAIGSMLLAIFFGVEVGFMGTVTMAILLGGLRGNEFGIALITFTVGTASILSVRKVRSRSWLFKSILWVTGGYVVAIGALELLRFSQFDETSTNLFYGVINGFLSPILTYGLMVIFEYVFDMTTDATLLELSDLNKPVLRKLALRASGSYHHSILVGSLAEAAAESVGANSLLARVGAYYHDIGKMDKPEYFVENQQAGRNPHDKLSPSMSYLILVSHVKRGLEIAEEHNLPKEIQDFISEHHGTSVVSYFYRKAQEQTDGGEVSESDFRYPGPKPRSKETGIVMLADSVEAAARSLKDPSVSRIRGMVSGIIDDRFRNSELDESPLTLRDLSKIQEAFVQILTGVFHGRIEYPDQEKLITGGRARDGQQEESSKKEPALAVADGEDG